MYDRATSHRISIPGQMIDALEPRVFLSGHRVVISLDHGTLNVRQPIGAPAISLNYHVRHHRRTQTFNISGRIRTYDAGVVKHILVNGANRDALLGSTTTPGTTTTPPDTSGLTSTVGPTDGARITIGSLDSSAQADPKIGDFANIGAPAVGAGEKLSRPTLIGDVNLDSVVDSTDIGIIIGLGYYGKSVAPHGWLDGDLNGDGKVNDADVTLIISTGTYNNGSYGSKTKTPGTAGPIPVAGLIGAPGTTIGACGDAELDFLYDSATGDLNIVYDGDPGISTDKPLQRLRLVSASGQFRTAHLNIVGFDLVSNSNTVLDCAQPRASIADGYDLGAVLPAGLTADQLKQDLTVAWQAQGSGLTLNGGDVVVT